MRILFSSHVFAPAIGGIERVSEMLAAEFVRQGHEVVLITQTPADAAIDFPYPVYRRPTFARLLALLRWCDVYFHNNISLPRAWPLLLVRRPWVVAHHVWIPSTGLAGRMKRWALRFATGISISSAIARHLPVPSTVVPNPYDDAVFRELPDTRRRAELIFVGRLVSDKGAHLAVSATARLATGGSAPRLTIVGTGPEESALRRQAADLGIADRVDFVGAITGTALARLLNEHKLLVVPSVWDEPFGLVALEGIACGCIPVGSRSGGLPDAIGDCGMTFRNGDLDELVRVLGELLGDPARQSIFRQHAEQHLQRHRRAAVAARYTDVLAMSVRGASG